MLLLETSFDFELIVILVMALNLVSPAEMKGISFLDSTKSNHFHKLSVSGITHPFLLSLSFRSLFGCFVLLPFYMREIQLLVIAKHLLLALG